MNKFDKKDSFVSTSTMSSTSSNGSHYAMDNTMNNNSINKNSPPSSLASSSNHSNYWQPWEDDILRKAVAEIGPRRWKEIASRIPTRTHVQCMQRWNKVLEPSIKKGSWTPEEDKLLTELVIQNGLYPDGDRGDGNSDKRYSGMTGRWTIVSKSIPGRTPKQCRERWILNLDPNINRAPWTEAEDYLLIQLQQQFGNKWSLISKSLPGRTENSVKTRFRSFSRKQQKLNNAKATTSMPTASVNLEQNVESDIKPELDSINRQIQHHFNGSNSIVQDHINSLDINSDQQHISKDNESLIGDGSLKRKRASDAHADENSSSTNVIDGSSELKKQRVPESLHLIKDDGLSSIGHGNMLLPTQEQVVTPRRRLTPPMLSTHSGNSALYSNDLQVSGYPHFHQSALHYLPNPFDQTRRLNLGKGNSAEQANSDNQSSVFNMQQQQQQQQQSLLEQAQQQQHNQIVMQLLQSSPSPSAVKSRTGSLRRFGSNGSAASNSSTSSGGNENNTNRLSVILSSSVLFPSNPHFSSTSQYMQSPTSLALADANLGKYLNAATAPLLTQNASSSSLLSNSLGTPLPNILGHKNDAIEWIVRR